MKDGSLNTVLEGLGFEVRETQVYLVLVELGASLATTVSRRTGINRSSVYIILESLKKKSVVSSLFIRGVMYFQAVSPSELFLIYERKLLSYKEKIPFLESLNRFSLLNPKVQVFEGREGLIKVLEDTLRAADDYILVYADVTEVINSSISDFLPTYIKRRIEKKLIVKGIFCDSPDSLHFKSRESSELREVNLLPRDLFPFENEINIYDNKFSMVSYKDDIGVIIESESIANTQKMIFNICWEFAKNYTNSKS
jgi:sugar-specific transcriptional regulator TrmB